MQVGLPDAVAPAAPSVSTLRRRVTRLTLLCVLEVLLAVPSVWAGYILGGAVQPQDPQQAQIWAYAAAGVLLVLFLAALILTARARKALKDTARIEAELSARIASVVAQVNAPKS